MVYCYVWCSVMVHNSSELQNLFSRGLRFRGLRFRGLRSVICGFEVCVFETPLKKDQETPLAKCQC